MKSIEDKAVTIVLAIMFALAVFAMGCDDEGRITRPDPMPETVTNCPEADSLRQVIKDLQFIVGQYRRMIECMQRGDSDCYGGV